MIHKLTPIQGGSIHLGKTWWLSSYWRFFHLAHWECRVAFSVLHLFFGGLCCVEQVAYGPHIAQNEPANTHGFLHIPSFWALVEDPRHIGRPSPRWDFQGLHGPKMNCWNVTPLKTGFQGLLICWTGSTAAISYVHVIMSFNNSSYRWFFSPVFLSYLPLASTCIRLCRWSFLPHLSKTYSFGKKT